MNPRPPPEVWNTHQFIVGEGRLDASELLIPATQIIFSGASGSENEIAESPIR